MLELLNGLSNPAWVGITGLIVGSLTALAAVFKGSQKTPIEVGSPLPPTDQIPYVLKEVRDLRADLKELKVEHRDLREEADRRLDEQDRMLGRIHTDTQVLRERRYDR